MIRVGAIWAMLAGSLGAASADCLEHFQQVTLTGSAEMHSDRWVAEQWLLTSDFAHCLVLPAYLVREDGTARWMVLEGEYRAFLILWQDVAPVAGRVEITGLAEFREPYPPQSTAIGSVPQPPFLIRVETVRRLEGSR